MADRDRPTRTETDASEGFLSRWSRRKAEARTAPAATPSAREEPSPAAQTAPESPQEAHDQEAFDPEDLPDIESLDANSDFTPFMRAGVPAELRTLALRKLWRSDPVFSKLDGLVEYGEDYTIASWPKGTIETVYRIGRGFVNETELDPAEAEPGPPEQQIADPASAPEPATASTVEEAPADSPQEPPQSIPAPAGSSEARPAPERTAPGAPAKHRRPLPRRG